MSSTSTSIAQFIFPNIQDIQTILDQYPARSGNPMVTRVAPSPTGFCHTGLIYTGLLNYKLAKQNKGIFILRIEDTDQARNTTNEEEQTGGTYSIVNGLQFFGIDYDEGPKLIPSDSKYIIKDEGLYGPYTQSQRLDLYKSFVKYLLDTDKAYVCFLSPQELDNIRTSQQLSKQATGIYGSYALSRNLSEDEIISRINNGESYVIRRKATAQSDEKITFEDGIKGTVEMQANYIDHVLIKSDGFPSYHLAHIVDDYLMGTTHIIRADEWLASVPFHIQLFQGFKDIFTRPQRSYNHNSPIQKLDNGNRRKLSKRKDPEADVQTLIDAGYPAEGIKTYLMCLLNSNFEDWRVQSNTGGNFTSYDQFEVSIDNCNTAGAIFDTQKLNHICAEYLAIMPLDQLVDQIIEFYTNNYQGQKIQAFSDIEKDNNNQNPSYDYLQAILSFDRNKKIHTTYQDIIDYLIPFLEDDLNIDEMLYPGNFSSEQRSTILNQYIIHLQDTFWGADGSTKQTKEEWFDSLKLFGKQHNIATSNAEFKEGGYIGKTGDLAMLLRVALYGNTNTPDIYEMIRVMGKERVIKRLQNS